jgi:hypothetical protein
MVLTAAGEAISVATADGGGGEALESDKTSKQEAARHKHLWAAVARCEHGVSHPVAAALRAHAATLVAGSASDQGRGGLQVIKAGGRMQQADSGGGARSRHAGVMHAEQQAAHQQDRKIGKVETFVGEGVVCEYEGVGQGGRGGGGVAVGSERLMARLGAQGRMDAVREVGGGESVEAIVKLWEESGYSVCVCMCVCMHV